MTFPIQKQIINWIIDVELLGVNSMRQQFNILYRIYK